MGLDPEDIEAHVRDLAQVAGAYARSVVLDADKPPLLTEALTGGDSSTLLEVALYLGAGFTTEDLASLMRVQAGHDPDASPTALLRAVLKGLPLLAASSSHDEVHGWAVHVFGGNVTMVNETLHSPTLLQWRINEPTDTDGGVRAAAHLCKQGVSLPVAAFTDDEVFTRRADIRSVLEDGSIAWAEQWRTGHLYDHPLWQHLKTNGDPTGEHAGKIAGLVARGWTLDEILTLIHKCAPRRWFVTLEDLTTLGFLSAQQLYRWVSVFDPHWEWGPTLLIASNNMETLPRLWALTGLPDEIIPYCAAAGLSPQEAIREHQAGRLTLDAVRLLVALAR